MESDNGRTALAIEQLTRQVQRLERKIDLLLKEKGKSRATWVKASVITQLTGWDDSKMHKARKYGYVEFKKEDGKLFYNLDSIHEKIIKGKANQ